MYEYVDHHFFLMTRKGSANLQFRLYTNLKFLQIQELKINYKLLNS